MAEPLPHLDLDATLDEADWTRATWDLPASNVGELLALLEERGMSREGFRELPVYRENLGLMPWLRDL